MVGKRMSYKRNCLWSLAIMLIAFTSCTNVEKMIQSVSEFYSISKSVESEEISQYFSLDKGRITYLNLPNCVQEIGNIEIGKVVKVIDGDSIVVIIDHKEVEVRYIGIDTPEFQTGSEVDAQNAMNVNNQLVLGKNVLLIKDVSGKDKFNRLLRYVFTQDYFINYELVKRGYAVSKAYPPDTACQDYLSINNN